MDKLTPEIQKAFNVALRSLTHTPEEIEKIRREECSLDYQRRQTISSEEAVAQAKKANEIAKQALEEAQKANEIADKAQKKARVSNVISIIALIVSGIIGLCQIPGFTDWISSLFR